MSTVNNFLNHPIETLERALHIRKQIDQLQKQVSSLFGAHPPAIAGLQLLAPKRRGRPKGKKMSAAARAKIAAAQRARWAKSKGTESVTPAPVVKTVKKKKGKMSAEGRARIVAAQKLRWAKVKAGKSSPAKAAPAAKKKKRHLSPEARARIVAAVKARWAKVKKGK